MTVIPMTLGVLDTSCYLIASENKNAAFIDPAGDVPQIMSELEKNGLTLRKILLTHGHFDHTGGVYELARVTGAKVYLHKNDVCMSRDDFIKNVSYLVPGYVFKPYTVDVELEDGDVIELDEIRLKVMLTKGHTAGSVVYMTDDCIFSGDTLFCGSIGRTDMYSGSTAEINKSLAALSALEGDYTVYPGHGEETTLEHERRYNPYMR